MNTKALTWIAVSVAIAILAISNISADEKHAGTSPGLSPRVAADYLRAVIMAHLHF